MGQSRNVEMVPDRWLLLRDRWFNVTIHVEAREQEDGTYKYAVVSSGPTFLNMTVKAFCYDMRDDDKFMKETRHDTKEQAFEAFKEYVEHCCQLGMSHNHTEMAIQYKFNNKQVKAHPNIIEKMNKYRKD